MRGLARIRGHAIIGVVVGVASDLTPRNSRGLQCLSLDPCSDAPSPTLSGAHCWSDINFNLRLGLQALESKPPVCPDPAFRPH